MFEQSDAARVAIAALATALAWGLGCAETEGEGPAKVVGAQPLSVYAVSHPLQYFADRIGGEHVEAVLPVPPDLDPAFWNPPADIVSDYQSADLILENGAGYATWTRYATLPRASRVDTSSEFHDRLIAESGAVTHGHGPKGEHTHAETAFTTWLDPTLAILQAHAVAEALIRRRPNAERDFRAGLAALESDLRELDLRLRRALVPFVAQSVLFSHPVYQYFAHRYGLTGHSLHWEPGQLPDPSEWKDLEARLEESPAHFIFFEGEPHPEVEKGLQALGVRTIVFAPGGNRVKGRDWLVLMRENAGRVEDARARVIRDGSQRR